MDWIFNKMDYKWIGLEQKWIGSRKLEFLPIPNYTLILHPPHLIQIRKILEQLVSLVVLSPLPFLGFLIFAHIRLQQNIPSLPQRDILTLPPSSMIRKYGGSQVHHHDYSFFNDCSP